MPLYINYHGNQIVFALKPSFLYKVLREKSGFFLVNGHVPWTYKMCATQGHCNSVPLYRMRPPAGLGLFFYNYSWQVVKFVYGLLLDKNLGDCLTCHMTSIFYLQTSGQKKNLRTLYTPVTIKLTIKKN